ncbi:ABC transporter ATP-binding protein [Agromyces seonyuensis]|uniref:ATP-binding cassette domain-containing protein n=1 Tax=Agromyces seonyuensis TaxID=2662446 RepID=A0A6I4P6D1_9MICO|nr:ATP-binding cassette domain-containing protein [Agromyces seonyuensis]MWB99157.1 ATP-binding cassette domain-containing protein [Agromyces seonyuensis]
MLELTGITKAYGGRRVLDDITFTVGDGRMTGFVGGNGAGKTTTMRIILGVLASDGGAVTLNGTPITAADRRRIGYMPEERGLYPKMKVLEQIVYFGRLHGWNAEGARRNAVELLERLGLEERMDDTLESLSLGNQQRAQIATSLVHRPELLVLDEPFSGLDPIAVQTVQQVLADAAADGAPVLFSSHQLDIVERLCDDLVIIAGGTIRAAGSRDALQTEFGGAVYEIEVGGDIGWLREQAGIHVLDFDGGRARFEADTDAARGAAVARAAAGGDLLRFGREHTTLAQIFTEVIR